ncbi:MAG: substrate-binding domain-containing protein [Devosia sp.]
MRISELAKGAALAGAIGLLTLTSAMSADDKLVIGVVTAHHLDQFQERIWVGARAAAERLGVEVRLAAPDGFNPEAQLALVQDMANSGVDGIATPATSESMADALNKIVAGGIPLVTFNIRSENVKAPYVGEKSTENARVLGRAVVEKLGGSGVSGKIITGLCAPGFPVLENRGRGVAEGLKTAPGIEVLGPFDTKLAATENYAAWESLAQAHPDAIAMIGLCAPDIATLGKVKEAGGYKWLIAGYDTTAENLDTMDRGLAWMAMGQSETMQGYMPVVMLVESLRAGLKEVPIGYLDSGAEIVTRDNVDQPYGLPKLTFDELRALAKDDKALIEYYDHATIDGPLADWKSLLVPLAEESK